MDKKPLGQKSNYNKLDSINQSMKSKNQGMRWSAFKFTVENH